jgi:hypothetical protein
MSSLAVATCNPLCRFLPPLNKVQNTSKLALDRACSPLKIGCMVVTSAVFFRPPETDEEFCSYQHPASSCFAPWLTVPSIIQRSGGALPATQSRVHSQLSVAKEQLQMKALLQHSHGFILNCQWPRNSSK